MAAKSKSKPQNSIRKTSKNKSKKPTSKYQEKLVVNGTFEQLVKELVTPIKHNSK